MNIQIQPKLQFLVLIFLLFVKTVLCQEWTAACDVQWTPVFGGGMSRESVTCFEYDSTNKFFLIGGLSDSNDYIEEMIDRAYVVALDYKGTQQWGKYLNLGRHAIQQPMFCSLNGEQLIVQVFTGKKMYMVKMNVLDGKVSEGVSLNMHGYQLNRYQYAAAGDFDKGYILSFIEETGKLRIINLQSNYYENGIQINWAKGIDHFDNQHWPMDIKRHYESKTIFVFTHYRDRYGDAKLAIVKMNALTGEVLWTKTVEFLLYVRDTKVTDEGIFLCGRGIIDDANTDAILHGSESGHTVVEEFLHRMQTQPIIAHLDLDGNMVWAHGVTGGEMEHCTGIDLETTNKTISASFSNGTDVIFLQIGYEEGNYLQSTSISFTDQDMQTYGLRIVDGVLFISGSATGAQTRVGNIKTLTSQDFFFVQFDWWNRRKFLCVLGQELDIEDDLGMVNLSTAPDIFHSRQIESDKDFQDYTYYYSQRVSGSWDQGTDNNYLFTYLTEQLSKDLLLMFTKRACADGLVEEFKEECPKPYPIVFTVPKSVQSYFTDSTKVIGHDANQISDSTINRLVQYEKTLEGQELIDFRSTADYFKFQVDIQTEGMWAVSLVNCFSDSIYQANIAIKAKNNFLPNFKEDLQQVFIKSIGDYLKYNMPLASDPEADPIEITLMDIDENRKVPPFVFYSNTSRSLQFLPSDKKTQGRTYDFNLALADVSKCKPPRLYNIHLQMQGAIIDWVYLTFELQDVTNTTGKVVFNNEVNTTWFVYNFYDQFYSYVTNGQGYTNVSLNWTEPDVYDEISTTVTFKYLQVPGRAGDLWPGGSECVLVIRPVKDVDISGLYFATEYYDFDFLNTSAPVPPVWQDQALFGLIAVNSLGFLILASMILN